jgi:hypothetical protein
MEYRADCSAVPDFSGPLIANAAWDPHPDPFGGEARTAATPAGAHLFTGFELERKHRDRRIEDSQPLIVPPKQK